MRVYDFDGTIYDGDSTIDFYLFCLRRHPKVMATLIPNAVDGLAFKTGRMRRTEFKERFMMRLLSRVDTSAIIDEFCDEHIRKVKDWYISQSRSDDMVISASPKFVVKPMMGMLGIGNVVATEVDMETGHFLGPNMRGQEKVAAYQELFPHEVPEEFYTDDSSDAPMARLAESAYLVQGDRVEPFRNRDSRGSH